MEKKLIWEREFFFKNIKEGFKIIVVLVIIKLLFLNYIIIKFYE